MIIPPTLLVAAGIFLLISAIVLVLLSYKVRANISLRYEFLSIISHKFRTPLTSVRWLIENLVETEKDEFRKKSLQDIDDFNQKLIDLTNTMIELTDTDKSYREQYNFKEVSACELVNLCAKPFKDLAGVKNISFSVQCANENMKINVDQGRFEFVIHTILENSVMYTKAGGKVEVSVASVGNKVLINVADSGIGISKLQLNHMFSEFHRAPNAKSFDTEGLGVGLFLAQRIVHRLKGEIRVSSEGEGFGSLFEIILPKVK